MFFRYKIGHSSVHDVFGASLFRYEMALTRIGLAGITVMVQNLALNLLPLPFCSSGAQGDSTQPGQVRRQGRPGQAHRWPPRLIRFAQPKSPHFSSVPSQCYDRYIVRSTRGLPICFALSSATVAVFGVERFIENAANVTKATC